MQLTDLSQEFHRIWGLNVCRRIWVTSLSNHHRRATAEMLIDRLEAPNPTMSPAGIRTQREKLSFPEPAYAANPAVWEAEERTPEFEAVSQS